MFSTFLFLCLVGTAFSQVPGFGHCPDVEVQPNFDVSKYLGRWYEVARLFTVWEVNGKCVTAHFTAGENGTIEVVTTQLSALTENLYSINGTARVPNASEPAKLKVQFPSVPLGAEINYWILSTDYKEFSVVFACSQLNLLHLKYGWILTRRRHPAASVMAAVDAVIEKNKLDRSIFLETSQDCKKNKQKK